jgi:hypothetical protein
MHPTFHPDHKSKITHPCHPDLLHHGNDCGADATFAFAHIMNYVTGEYYNYNIKRALIPESVETSFTYYFYMTSSLII